MSTALLAPVVRAEDLQAVSDALSDTLEKIEGLSFLLNDVRMDSRDSPISQRWLLHGFAHDALLDAETIVKFALAIKTHIHGGYSQREAELMEAAGGSFDFNPRTI